MPCRNATREQRNAVEHASPKSDVLHPDDSAMIALFFLVPEIINYNRAADARASLADRRRRRSFPIALM